jgi:hypothetical protein
MASTISGGTAPSTSGSAQLEVGPLGQVDLPVAVRLGDVEQRQQGGAGEVAAGGAEAYERAVVGGPGAEDAGAEVASGPLGHGGILA